MPPSRCRVLIIDDEPSICRVFAIGLARAGFDVQTAMTGEEGLRLLEQGPVVDLLVLDLRIHDMRGDTIFELARARYPELATRTLFVSGDITERADRIVAACHCPLMRKPFELRDLVQKLRGMLPRTSGNASA